MDRRQRNAERSRAHRKVRRERELKLRRFHDFVRDNYPKLFSQIEVEIAAKQDLVPYEFLTEPLEKLQHGSTFTVSRPASGVSNDECGEPKFAIKLNDGTILYQVGYINLEQPEEQPLPGGRKSVITFAGCEDPPKVEGGRDVIEILDDDVQTAGDEEVVHGVCNGIVFAEFLQEDDSLEWGKLGI